MNILPLINFYQKYKLIVFPLLVAFSSVILIVFVIFPQIKNYLLDNKTILNLSQGSYLLEVKAQDLSGFDQDELSKKVSLSLLSLPVDKELPQIIGALQNIVLKNGFTLVSFQVAILPQTAQAVPDFTTKLELSGPSALMPQLLSGIEDSVRVMKVSGIEITTARASGVSQVSLSVDIFYAPLPSSLGDLDAPLPKLTEKDEEFLTNLEVNFPSQAVAAQPSFVSKGKVNPFE